MQEERIMKPLYSIAATATGGRDGKVESPGLQLTVSMPKELGGPGGNGTNPEQLFAAGYGACFLSALKLVARMQKLPADEASITAEVTLGRTDAGGFGLAVKLRGRLPGLPREEAEKLMHAAHGVCPYSNATRGNIAVELSVEA
jgi:osmotically inducible protein OsmC